VRYFLLIFLFGCNVTAQTESETAKKDREFENLLSKVEENTKASAKVQEEASKKQTQIVTETVSKIITLKEENKDLKTELDEVKTKLDSATADTIMPFVLLPIPRKKVI
jgi:cell shape-determining protein MreC